MLTRLHRTGQYVQSSWSLCGNLISFIVDYDFLPASETCIVVLDWTSTGENNILSWTPLWHSPIDDVVSTKTEVVPLNAYVRLTV